jgi:hypothetical protein
LSHTFVSHRHVAPESSKKRTKTASRS